MVAQRRILVYSGLSIVLLVACYASSRNSWHGLNINHTVLETATTLVGVFVGILSLVRYYTRREVKTLFIGMGLMGAGILDSYFLFETSGTVSGNLHQSAPNEVLCGLKISFLYLSALFVLSWFAPTISRSAVFSMKQGEYRVYFLALVLIIACGLLFKEPGVMQSATVKTMLTVIATLFFLVTLAGYLHGGKWRDRNLEHWSILFLITVLAGQIVLLTTADEINHIQVQLAHELKILAYLMLLTGMLISMFRTFRDAADTSLKITEANIALKLEAEERRRAQAQIEEARNRAEKSDKAKSEFLSSMSHELRTPLNSILGFGQLLETDPDISADGHRAESVGQIMQAGRHLLDLINEVLDLSRIETGNMELLIESVPVRDSIEVCLSLSAPLAEKRGISVETLLSGTEGKHVMADMTRFRQILLNLISNAIKYNRDAGTLKVSASHADNSMVRVTVTDTGPGLSEGQISQIFEPFNRLSAANSKIEGTGIGLTITQRLVEMMGGKIGVESQIGSGATFWFELPSAQPPTPKSE